jgi:hypothetical protein
MGIGVPSSNFETTDAISVLTERYPGVRRQTYREGETIFAQGQCALSLFYICSGKVRKTRVSTSGKTRVDELLRCVHRSHNHGPRASRGTGRGGNVHDTLIDRASATKAISYLTCSIRANSA